MKENLLLHYRKKIAVSIATWTLLGAILLEPLAASSAPAAVETAVPANAFVDTVGVVTHFNFENTYRSNPSVVIQLLANSGIRHIRDGLGDSKSRDLLAQLGVRGVKVDLVTDDRESLRSIVGYPSLLPAGMVDAFEGPNELDLFRGEVYLQILESFVPALYRAVKSDPRTSSIAVIGPSLTTARHYAAIGDLSAYMDYGNIHNYVFGRNPGTLGWNGPEHYGSIPFMMNAARKISAEKPIMTTEIGYGTSSKPGELNESTQLKYLMRVFFEQALHGVKRTYSYAFLDDGAASFNTYGIVRHDLSPKPSYTGLRNLIKLLSDSGSPRNDTLRYVVDGPSSVHHYLLEKSDGGFYLALWNETESLAVRPGGDERDLHVPSVNVKVSLDRDFPQAKVYAFDNNGNMNSSPLSAPGKTMSIPVTDGVSIVEWEPNAP